MQIIPTQAFLLISMHVPENETGLTLPDGVTLPTEMPHGIVVDIGPEVKEIHIGAKVCFLPANIVAGFEGKNQFLIPEQAVFATLEDV